MTQAVDSENAKCVIISLREKGPNTYQNISNHPEENEADLERQVSNLL